MFTGIVEETGRVAAFTQGPDSWKLQVAASLVASDFAAICNAANRDG